MSKKKIIAFAVIILILVCAIFFILYKMSEMNKAHNEITNNIELRFHGENLIQAKKI